MTPGTITFHLVGPDPEFLYKLTLPFAYPVPSSVPDEEQKTAGVPGTGPYMMAAPMTDEGLCWFAYRTSRSGRQAAQPDGYVDRIEWTFGVEPDAQVDAVAAGDADLALDASIAASALPALGEVRGTGAFLAGTLTLFFVLDNEAPPFDHPQVRKAINLAIDRDRVVEFFGGEGAGLPRASNSRRISPGTSATARTPWNPVRKGRAGARRLRRSQRARPRVGHRRDAGRVRVHPHSCPAGTSRGDYVVGLLGELGYRGSVRSVPVTQFFDRGQPFPDGARRGGGGLSRGSNFIVKLHLRLIYPFAGFSIRRSMR